MHIVSRVVMLPESAFMNDVFERYGELLREVDRWFAGCVQSYPDQIICHKGCSSCCRGLFDITLMDALYLKIGFESIAMDQRQEILLRAQTILNSLSKEFPAFVSPWFLNDLADDELAAMMPEDDPTPCLLLSANGECLVYENRPMTCRLNGIPLIDLDGEPFSDEWCTLNFVDHDPALMEDIRYQFRELFLQEQLLFRELTKRIYGKSYNERDTIIPAALLLTSR